MDDRQFIDWFNDELDEIWLSSDSELQKHCPLYLHKFKKKGVLLVGLNPAFSTSFLQKLNSDQFSDPERVKKSFEWKGHPDPAQRELCADLEKISWEKHNHYSIAKELDRKNWSSAELYRWRETDSANLPSRTERDVDSFWVRQKKLFIEHVLLAEPRLILSAYKEPAVQLLKAFDIKEEDAWSDQDGVHYIDHDQLEERVPCIFWGGRGMDNFSKQRLIWHARKFVR